MLSSSETSVQITNALEKLIDSGISLGERVLGALIIFIVGKFLVNWLNRLFARILEKRKVDPSIQSFLKSMVNILLLIMLILAVIGKLGIELTGFAALLASAGVAIGMALSGNLQNFAGGLIILLFRPYKVGDYIDASTGASGTVKEIQIFHTILITPDNKMVYVPNGAMSSGVITNYSNLDTRRIEWNFGVDYGEDFEKVEKILRNIIKADQRILTAPAPFIELGELAASSVNIKVRVWVKSSDYWDTGRGIAPEDIPRVFEKGYTGCNGRVNQGSSGIGLYLCKKVMTRLAHEMVIESQPGVGTKVKLRLDMTKFTPE